MTFAQYLKNPILTQIGSLPQVQVDSALEYSFRFALPFLPELPKISAGNFMLPQAIVGFPGVVIQPDGHVVVNTTLYQKRKMALENELHNFFTHQTDITEFDVSLPSKVFEPWLWELQEKKVKVAKVQMTGPLTLQWALKNEKSEAVYKDSELCHLVYQWLLARALVTVHRLKKAGIHPVLFLDEPGLYGLNKRDPKHLLGLKELSLFIKTLNKQKVWVGIHCCSNTLWDEVLKLDVDLISMDVTLSLPSLLSHSSAFGSYLDRGGRFAFGVIPTNDTTFKNISASALFQHFIETWSQGCVKTHPHFVTGLKEAIYTPACGLALHPIPNTEHMIELQNEFLGHLERFLFSQIERSH